MNVPKYIYIINKIFSTAGAKDFRDPIGIGFYNERQGKIHKYNITKTYNGYILKLIDKHGD